MGNEWLAVLEDFGVDVRNYLRTEYLQQPERGSVSILLSFFHYGIASRYIIFSENSPRISWDWYIDPEGHASKVLHEFRNLGPVRHLPRKDHELPDEMFNWPYFYSRLDRCYSALWWCTRTEEESSSMRSIIKILENRFERRWLKKAKKLRRAQGIREFPKVPGAWID
jgi:DNA segregation ATPase FtsK/SpoIIIE-like protein